MDHDTSLLLGLDHLVVERVELESGGCRVIHLVTADSVARRCPSCGVCSSSVKEWVRTGPRDVPLPVPVRLVWHKRRWRCAQPDCPRSSFTESVPQIPPGRRVTGRLREAAGAAVVDGGRTVTQAGRDLGLSWPVAQTAVTEYAQTVLTRQPEPVTALGIDETRRGAPKFEADPDTGTLTQLTDRWHTGFVDLTGEQGLLGQVEGRSAADARSWLGARTQAWRDGVEVVAIDMCPAYRAAVREYLPNATLVVDHFHVVQLANQVLTTVRRRVSATLRGRRVRKNDPEYGIRRRLSRNHEDLTTEKFTDMWNRLIDLGPAGQEILTAWIAKEELRRLLALARTHPTRTQISDRLYRFYTWCADTNIPELRRLATTIETWWPQIEAFLHTGITNATSEGVNRVIKLEARNAYGFRNPTNQRLRSRCATTRSTRRQTKPD